MAKSGHSVEGICSYDEPLRGIGYEPIQYRGGVVYGVVTFDRCRRYQIRRFITG